MAPLVVNFNQLADLAINPSLGTINTALLHSLIHVIIDQMQLSNNIVEFHGIGSEAIENVIVNSQLGCGLTIRQYEVEEIDEPSGNTIKKRTEAEKPAESETAKLFTVHINKLSNPCMSGNQIQVLPISRSSIYESAVKVMPLKDRIIKPDNSGGTLKPLFDFINVTKRLDALEIGTRQLADIMKQFKSDTERLNSLQSEHRREIELLQQNIENIFEELKDLNDTKNDDNDDDRANMIKKLEGIGEKTSREIQELQKSIAVLKTELDELKKSNDEKFEAVEATVKSFEESFCQQLNSNQDLLVSSMTEIQEMMDAKLDKCFVPHLKKFIHNSLSYLDEKIEKVDCPKSLAAGATMKMYKDLNCISCGGEVIQSQMPKLDSSLKLYREDHKDANTIQLLGKPSRNCGGIQTITLTIEKVFRCDK